MFVNICYLLLHWKLSLSSLACNHKNHVFVLILQCGKGWVGTISLCSVWCWLESLTGVWESKESHVWCLSCLLFSNREVVLFYTVAWDPQENKSWSLPDFVKPRTGSRSRFVGQSKPQARQIWRQRKLILLWMERSSMCGAVGGFKQEKCASHGEGK